MDTKSVTMKKHTADVKAGVTRREFLVSAAKGLVLGFVLPELLLSHQARAAGTEGQVNSWLSIGTDDSITLSIGGSEMGEGSFSGLAQILAEDLMVDYGRIATRQGGPTLATPSAAASSAQTSGRCATPRPTQRCSRRRPMSRSRPRNGPA